MIAADDWNSSQSKEKRNEETDDDDARPRAAQRHRERGFRPRRSQDREEKKGQEKEGRGTQEGNALGASESQFAGKPRSATELLRGTPVQLPSYFPRPFLPSHCVGLYASPTISSWA